jgi:DNA mismatch repair ATPase MutS
VARLAGLPGSVTERAEQLLRALEQPEHGGNGHHHNGSGGDEAAPRQLALDGFGTARQPVAHLLDRLLSLDLERLTPREALDELWDVQKLAGRRQGP